MGRAKAPKTLNIVRGIASPIERNVRVSAMLLKREMEATKAAMLSAAMIGPMNALPSATAAAAKNRVWPGRSFVARMLFSTWDAWTCLY